MGRVWNKSDHSHREDNEAREIEEVRPLVSHRYTLVQIVNATSGVVTIVSIVNRPRQARCLKNGPFKPYSRCSRSFLLPFSFSAASGGLERMKARQRRLPTYWRSRPSEVTPDTSRFHKRQTRFCLPQRQRGAIVHEQKHLLRHRSHRCDRRHSQSSRPILE